MKKSLLIIAFIISNLSFGQITLEHSYSTDGFNNNVQTYAFHTDNGLNYYTLNTTENKVYLYNSNHYQYEMHKSEHYY